MPRDLRALPLLVLGMGGLGDGIYQRPLLRAQASSRQVYVTTPWPELYADLGVHPVRPWSMELRTQQKHIARIPAGTWHRPPQPHERRTLTYQLRNPATTVLGELEGRMQAGPSNPHLGPLQFDLPDLGPCPVEVPPGRRLAVLRPSTIRREWPNTARAPLPAYLEEAACQLRAAGYYVVAVADIAEPDEWLEGSMPAADSYYVHGELTPPQVVALVQHASVVVGGVGWIVPAALHAHVPLVCIGGGHGGYNAPERLVDARMDSSRVRWVLPDRYCRCTSKQHRCDKTISFFPSRFAAALQEATAA